MMESLYWAWSCVCVCVFFLKMLLLPNLECVHYFLNLAEQGFINLSSNRTDSSWGTAHAIPRPHPRRTNEKAPFQSFRQPAQALKPANACVSKKSHSVIRPHWLLDIQIHVSSVTHEASYSRRQDPCQWMGWKPANGQIWTLGRIRTTFGAACLICLFRGTMDTPVEVTLSCHNQEDLDEGPEGADYNQICANKIELNLEHPPQFFRLEALETEEQEQR